MMLPSLLTVRWVYAASCLLLLLAAFKFVYQDFLQRPALATDFRPAYVATRLWLQGRQPYEPAGILTEVQHSVPQAHADAEGNYNLLYPLYPPSSFPVLALFAIMPWSVASVLEMVTCAAVYGLLVYICALKLAGVRRFYFAAFALAFAPFHGGFATGNLSAAAGPLACVAVLLTGRSPVGASVALGLAAAIKPQLAGLFILHLLLGRRWNSFAIASGTFLLCLGVGTGWLGLHGIDWFGPYRYNVNLMVSPFADNGNAITVDGRVNFQLYNVQPLIYWVTHNLHAAVWGSMLIWGFLLSAYIFLMFKHRHSGEDAQRQLDFLAWLSLLGFISVYQGYYSAISFLIVALWGLSNWRHPLGKFVTVYLTVFLVPFSKLAIISELLITVVSGNGTSSSSTLLRALFQMGLPSGMGESLTQQIALALPNLFIVIVSFALFLDLLMKRRVACDLPGDFRTA